MAIDLAADRADATFGGCSSVRESVSTHPRSLDSLARTGDVLTTAYSGAGDGSETRRSGICCRPSTATSMRHVPPVSLTHTQSLDRQGTLTSPCVPSQGWSCLGRATKAVPFAAAAAMTARACTHRLLAGSYRADAEVVWIAPLEHRAAGQAKLGPAGSSPCPSSAAADQSEAVDLRAEMEDWGVEWGPEALPRRASKAAERPGLCPQLCLPMTACGGPSSPGYSPSRAPLRPGGQVRRTGLQPDAWRQRRRLQQRQAPLLHLGQPAARPRRPCGRAAQLCSGRRGACKV